MRRGREALASAVHLLQGEYFSDAISRAYYAAFHFARALLFLKGLEPKTHHGVIQLLSLHFVRPGMLQENIADHLRRLETFRELSDYDAEAEFGHVEAERRIRDAEEFINECTKILEKSGLRVSPWSTSRHGGKSARRSKRNQDGR
ncbi:MAG TPA: HEPN domain-containing protein [Acidobacteriota bacterium]